MTAPHHRPFALTDLSADELLMIGTYTVGLAEAMVMLGHVSPVMSLDYIHPTGDEDEFYNLVLDLFRAAKVKRSTDATDRINAFVLSHAKRA